MIGRDASDKEKFGERGLIFIGKGYVKMGQYTSLSNRILMDVVRSHVVLVAGKGEAVNHILSAQLQKNYLISQKISAKI